MTYTYFRRFRMEYDVTRHKLEPQVLPAAYRFEAWHPDWLSAHAQAKYLSFRDELDTSVFPCLGDEAGCLRLMRDISNRDGFLPRATWLIRFHPDRREQADTMSDHWVMEDSTDSLQNRPDPMRSEFDPSRSPLTMTRHGLPVPVATIQGIQTDQQSGAIQNIGVIPGHRGQGLGGKLIRQSLWGFQQAGVERVILEVTAQNRSAFRLYEQLGFRYLRTVYKCQDIVF